MPSKQNELPNGVRLWWNHFDDNHGPDGWPDVLSKDERTRADQFRFEKDRAWYVARRAFVRRVLAGYTGVAPAAIRYRISTHGRPELDPACGLSFNASHSDGLVVVAVSGGQTVGVDIERLRPIDDALELATRFFSQNEIDYLGSTPESSLGRAFLTIWTRKESYVKAVGGGLSMPLNEFDVTSADGGSSCRPHSDHGEARYVCTSLDMFEGYSAAVTLSDDGDVTEVVSVATTS